MRNNLNTSNNLKSNKNKQILLKKPDFVIQSTELSRAIYACTMLARKIIAYASLKIREKEITATPEWYSGRTYILLPASEFRISELLKALEMSKNGKNYSLIRKTVESMRTLGVELINDEKRYVAYNWFEKIDYNEIEDRIEFIFTGTIGWTLYHLQDGYSSMDIKTIGAFKSFYAFRFYEIAKSWQGQKGKSGNKKNEWWFKMSVEEIRKTFKISEDAYKGRMNNFYQKVIKIPIDELNEVCDEFQIEVSKVMRGRSVVGFHFECKEKIEKSEKLKIVKDDTWEMKAEKRIVEAEDKFFQKYKDELDNQIEFEKTQLNLFSGFERSSLAFRNRARQSVINAHKEEWEQIQKK